MTEDVTSKLAKTASAGIESGKARFDAVTAEAKESAGEVRDNFQDALDQSLEERPYTTLLFALGLGFALGAIWRR
jgi:hypothetical protein